MKNILLFSLLAALLLPACRPDSLTQDPRLEPIDYSVLPPITQEGKNTFGCKVNGEVWVPRVELWVPQYDKAASFSEKNGKGVGNITCRILTSEKEDFMQVIFGPTIFQTGKYYLNPNESTYAQLNRTPRIGSSPSLRYKTDEADSINNWVNLTLIDTVRNILSGTFNFVLYQNKDNVLNKNEKIILSDGRFDMPYYQN